MECSFVSMIIFGLTDSQASYKKDRSRVVATGRVLIPDGFSVSWLITCRTTTSQHIGQPGMQLRGQPRRPCPLVWLVS